MKKLLNVLYVSTQGAYLSLEGETVLISVISEKKGQLPLLNLQGIICFGNVLCSPFLLGACAERGIAVSFLSANGRFLARIQGGVCGNVLLRRAQMLSMENPEKRTYLAQMFLMAKILNSRTILQRFLRDHGDKLSAAEQTDFQNAVSVMKQHTEKLMVGRKNGCIRENDELMGMEGAVANLYFGCFPAFIVKQKAAFPFTGRTRRPPLDRVNAMLSFAYTLLAHDCAAALESVGLDPAVGFFHALRPGRASLALDLMEEFRACLADRLVLSLINRNQVSASDFKVTETGAVRMNEKSRKTLIGEWQERKQDEIMHPYLNEKVKLGMLPYVQSLLLARFLRGDMAEYPPYFYR